MGSIFHFVHRNARIAATVGVVLAAIGVAGVIGWMTAPV